MTVEEIRVASDRPARARRASGAAAAPRTSRMTTKRHRAFYMFTAPWLVGFVLLTAFPMGYALWLSFTNFDAVSPHWHFVGLENYREALSDPLTRQSLGRTLLFTLISVPMTMIGGLILAVLVNRPLRARGLFRTLLYLPAVVPPVGTALTFKLVFDTNAGAANGVLDAFGMNAVTWLADPYARYVILMSVLWALGNTMIISLAGLQDIPRELQEASRIDGASAWRSFRSITLPLLSPVLLFQGVTGVIGALQTFMPLLLAADSSPAGTTSVPQDNYMYMINVFAQYFAYGRFGYASALLWILFAVIIAFTALIFKATSGAVFYNVDPEAKK
ncbi:carbohydrate ABC transporter permease [Streptomyces litchfieldiae]|uniref:Sugar ABC transporter permease n=1 Tax=Streptomyces litchfieldiae TaxID=3075543 RepID=A0ABU2MYT2_9ACTN|nr:sugar ABC transporter permease [Streptomyces sp. DSM 44938]MDT0346817.1 sugar ABC transporter permease [Streptomyces sp. DSM 44938]